MPICILLCASDGWSELNRGNDGKIVADPTKFPSGIKHVSDYIHSKGKHCFLLPGVEQID